MRMKEPRKSAPWPRRLGASAGALAVALALSACAFGDADLADLANNGVADEPDYETDVRPIMVEHCTSCHSVHAEGIAAVVPTLDTEGEVLDNICRIAVRAIQERSMPPGAIARLNARERLVLDRWMLDAYRGVRPVCDEVIRQGGGQ